MHRIFLGSRACPCRGPAPTVLVAEGEIPIPCIQSTGTVHFIFVFRKIPGAHPLIFRKTLLKWNSFENPQSGAIL